MTFCGSTDTRTGKPCKRPAGWGVAHTSAGPCKTHGKRATDKHPPAKIHHAPPYVIEDGVDYELPVALPYAVTKGGAKAVTAFLEAASQRSTMRFQFDPPYRRRSDGPVWMPSDNPLEEWAPDTRLAVLTQAHAAYHRNPIAKAAVRITRQFAVGRGHQVAYRNKDVEAVIEAFRSNPENAIHEYDKTLVEDLQIDGELFIRKVAGGPDESVIVPLRPWDIIEIKTAPGFLRRAEQYHLQETQRTTLTILDVIPEPVDEWIPAADMLHIAINRHSYELRGRSDLFVILPWLRAYKEWLENRARQNKYRNTLVWDVSIDAGGTAVADAKARYSTPPTDGSVVVHHAKETVQPMTNPVGAGDAAEDGRQIKLMSSVGVQLPEYMLSDGENANLASATAQELPALFKFIDTQEIMSEQVWTPIYQWVIAQAVETGELEAEVEVQDSDGDPVLDGNGQKEMISAEDAFSVEYADLNIDDPKTLAEALQIATLNDWISNQGAGDKVSTLMGLDPNIERKRIAQEQEQMRDEVAQGLRNPNPGDPVNDDDADEDADGNTTPAAAE